MSIVLQGSTSGSITLQEPAVAGSNTINLPAATGTAVLTGVSGNVDINAAGSNNVTLSTNSTERMRITSAGNVGVGTTSPTGKLHVYGSGEVQTLQRSSGSANNYTLFKTESGADQAYLGFSDAGVNDFAIYNVQNGYIRFATNNTERMRILSGGAVCVGTTSAVNNGTFNVSANNTIVALKITGSEGVMVDFRDNSNDQCGYIYSVASSNTTTYATSSDYRLKENIAPMTGALDKVAQLKPVTYTWTKSGIASQGFIAHELQAVVPECVVGEKDAVDEEGKPFYQGVDTSFLVATLTAAIQELKDIVDTQAIKITELEAKLEGTV